VALTETLVTGGFTLGAVVVTGLVTAQVTASRDRRERERAVAEAKVQDEERRRKERSDLYVRFYALIRDHHDRLLALTGMAQANREGRELPLALQGSDAKQIMQQILDQQAEMSRMLAEFAIFGSSNIRAAAEDFYNHALGAVPVAAEGRTEWRSGATPAAMTFLHAARDDLGTPLHDDDAG
jgi:hypothetical protein